MGTVRQGTQLNLFTSLKPNVPFLFPRKRQKQKYGSSLIDWSVYNRSVGLKLMFCTNHFAWNLSKSSLIIFYYGNAIRVNESNCEKQEFHIKYLSETFNIFLIKAGLEAEPVAAEAKVLPKRFTTGIAEFRVLLRLQASHESSSYPKSLF